MKELAQWVAWRYEERNGKVTKVPVCPRTGKLAAVDQPNTWSTYEEAVEAVKEHGYDGVGFVFTEEDPYAGIDLDKCRDPETGQMEDWAIELIERLGSYTELSPSGTGVHILLKATLPPSGRRKGQVEMYDAGRFFTVSGRHLPGTPKEIRERQAEVEVLHRELFAAPTAITDSYEAHSEGNNDLSDQEILAQAMGASNGEKFSRLWSGDTNGYGSESEADQALCSLLAFWTGPDSERIDSLFRQSGLYRKKWERADYRERTISKALDGRTDFYQSNRTVPINMKGTNSTDSTDTDFGTDRDLIELPEAPPFPVDALPKSCQRFVREAAVSIGCPPDLVAVPLLGLLSAAIGNSRQVELKHSWKESAALFAVVVAEPGDKKTPAQKVALAPLWQAQKRLKKEFQEEYEVYEEELRHWEAERKTAAQDGEPAPPRPKEPLLKSVVVDDVTVERLAEILDENPRGVTSAQDELSGWILSMNQYKAGGKGADRQFWLRGWSNAPVKVDRKSRKVPAIISEPWVSVIGSIQPEILPELGIGRNDGMMDRFLYSYPEPRHLRHTDEEISATAELSVLELYEKLQDLKMPESDGEPFPGTVQVTKDAWEVFKELADELSEEAHSLGFPRRLRGAWSKLEAYLARLSLILALSRVVEANEKEQVEPQDVLAAWVLVGYFKAHARRVFAELCGSDPMDSLAVALAEFLKEGDGKWEGTATELREELAKRNAQGVPNRPEELSKKIRAIAARSGALNVQDGYRGKERVLRINSLKTTVGTVGAVGDVSPSTDSTDSTDGDSEESSEKMAAIMREPSSTSSLSSEEWEEV